MILRNLTIEGVVADLGNGDQDAITLKYGTHHVWIDHCDLRAQPVGEPFVVDGNEEYYDGLIDITRGCDFVTVSWTMTEAHVFNHYTRVTALTGHIGNGVSLRDNAQVRIDNCYFDHTLLEGDGMSPSFPIITGYSSAVGGPGVVTNAESNIFVKTVEPLIETPPGGLRPALCLRADPRQGRACGRLCRRGRDPADRVARGGPADVRATGTARRARARRAPRERALDRACGRGHRRRMRDLKFKVGLIAALIGACGDSGRAMDSAGATDATGASTTAPGGSTGPTPTSSDGSTVGQGGDASTSTTGADEATAASTTPEPATSSSGPASAGDSSDSSDSSGSSDTSERECVIAGVEDTLAFTYSKSIDLAPINQIQASFYNQDAQEVVFFSFQGPGRRYSLDGTPLGDVMAPPEALPALDGASFDQIKRVGMLITQGCAVVDVDPVTMATLEVLQLDVAKFGLQTCAGVAIGVDGSMYVTSFFTDEIVVMTRDGQTELDRIDLAAVGLPRPDGISLIAGSDNFLVLSTTGVQSAILTPSGDVIVGPAPTGQGLPPMIGGGITNPDAVLTVCGNGHAWLCDEYGTQCHDYVPMDGDKDACACTIPQ